MANNAAQQCFLGDDGYMYCNAVMRNGTLVFSKSGKWFRFPANRRSRKKKKS